MASSTFVKCAPGARRQPSAQYGAFDVAAALAVFSAVRNWNMALIRSVSPGALAKPLNHPERGEMTFQVLIETMAGHDLNHISQTECIAGRAAQLEISAAAPK